MQPTAARSPGRKPPTRGTTSVMMPTISWPAGRGWARGVSRPRCCALSCDLPVPPPRLFGTLPRVVLVVLAWYHGVVGGAPLGAHLVQVCRRMEWVGGWWGRRRAGTERCGLG